jgi:hypothetical protein
MYEYWLNALSAGAKFNLTIIEMHQIVIHIDQDFDTLPDELTLTTPKSVNV